MPPEIPKPYFKRFRHAETPIQETGNTVHGSWRSIKTRDSLSASSELRRHSKLALWFGLIVTRSWTTPEQIPPESLEHFPWRTGSIGDDTHFASGRRLLRARSAIRSLSPCVKYTCCNSTVTKSNQNGDMNGERFIHTAMSNLVKVRKCAEGWETLSQSLPSLH